MPSYCYETKGGKVVTKVFPMGKAPKSITHLGCKAKRCYQAERVGAPALAGWPITCYGSGVNAAQAGELREHFRKAGVPTEVTRDGDPVYRNASHRRRALKCRGIHDRAAYL